MTFSVYLTTIPTIMFGMFSVQAALGEEITKRKVFVTFSLVTIVNAYLYSTIFAISQVSESIVALKRIKVGLQFQV